MASVPENESDCEFFARLDYEAAVEQARLEATYPAYEPTPQDLAEMADWSQNVEEHDDALALWLDFFGDSEEKSTYFIS